MQTGTNRGSQICKQMNMEVGKLKEYGEYSFPYSENLAILAEPVTIAGGKMELLNRMGVHPMEASDCDLDGSPTEWTWARYRRFFSSGAGLVWFEALPVQLDGRSNAHAAYLHEGNVDAYKRMISTLKEENPGVKCVAQLTHSGRVSKPAGTPEPVISMWNPHYNARVNVAADHELVDDDYLDRLVERFGVAAKLCEEAGFDAMDIKACSGYLYSELLCARTRAGKYGGSLENRARAFIDSIKAVKASVSSHITLASRYGFVENMPWPWSFGMDQENQHEWNLEEPLKVLDWMVEAGVELVNPTVGKVTVNYDFCNWNPEDVQKDNGLYYFDKFCRGDRALQQAHPEIAVIGADYAALHEDAPYVAAGALEQGDVTLAGFGRLAVAYPKFAHDIIEGNYDPKHCCIECGSCSKLLATQHPSGCVTRDPDTFLPLFKEFVQKK